MKLLAAFASVFPLIFSVERRDVGISIKDDSYPADFRPNFDSSFSVSIQEPLATAFHVLGTNSKLCELILLSPIASDCQLGILDSVNVDGPLEDAFARTAPAAPAGQGFPRQHFSYIETVKIIPGLSFLDIVVHLNGTYTWDQERRITLYESSPDTSITVRKVCTFEPLNNGAATNVSEVVHGQCPILQQPIVQFGARKVHRAQMSLYHTLFGI
ncbi:hypothetical protein MSAN_01868800 [Mycena sanguinolenta]|uniref:Uncharacterized protein n=1 Tax=Mycena sanguinolenta TaxID=230812 RepID=A0A8H6XTE8_9AGAR|nr:hypothetical protein MSAN_01868800 [Mycena sanguinolenta]